MYLEYIMVYLEYIFWCIRSIYSGVFGVYSGVFGVYSDAYFEYILVYFGIFSISEKSETWQKSYWSSSCFVIISNITGHWQFVVTIWM